MKRTITANWEPVTIAEAKTHIQGLEGINDFDDFITSLIKVAREVAEEFTWRPIVTSTYELRLPSFSDNEIQLKPDVLSITYIKYINTAGVEQTINSADYYLASYKEPALVMPAYQKSWPAARGFEGDVTITFVAGFAAAADVEQIYKQAILMMVKTWFDNREDVTNRTVNTMPEGSEFLLKKKRLFSF